jgi:tetratricopeptide (TPR) repeat protein
MKPSKSHCNLLLVGDDQERVELVSAVLRRVMPGIALRSCTTLRLGAPEATLENRSAIVFLWESNTQQDWRGLLLQETPTHRSFEGIICDISSHYGAPILRRSAVLAQSLSREEVTFLGEYELGCVQALSTHKSEWPTDCAKFAARLEKLIATEDDNGSTPAERSVRHFEIVLKNWKTTPDDVKVAASDQLLRQLGDTARYCELMSRKSYLECDLITAEHWLRRAIDKNPNYLRALQGLADIYIERGHFKDGLAILEKLRLNSPRNPARLAKIAACHLALGDLDRADAAYSKSLCLDDQSMQTRENLAKVRLALGDYESAKLLVAHCGQVSQIASYLNSCGIKLVKEGRYQESIDHYKKAQLVLPSNTNRHQILFNIGLAYAKWGKFVEAKQYAQLALAREPEYEKAVQLLKSVEARLTQ